MIRRIVIRALKRLLPSTKSEPIEWRPSVPLTPGEGLPAALISTDEKFMIVERRGILPDDPHTFTLHARTWEIEPIFYRFEEAVRFAERLKAHAHERNAACPLCGSPRGKLREG